MKLKRTLATIALIAATATAASAGFNRWTSKAEKDPLTGGTRVTAGYMASMRSGVFMFCDTKKQGLEVRAVAGWRLSESRELQLHSMDTAMSIAVDDSLMIVGEKTSVGTCGNGIACSSATIGKDSAMNLVEAMIEARGRIAIKDGISDRPMLMKSRGSTKSGKALAACLNSQQ